jgi:hypothetical protein
MTEALPLPPFVFYIVGYAFVLVAALVVVNLLLHRLTRRERAARPAKRDREG